MIGFRSSSTRRRALVPTARPGRTRAGAALRSTVLSVFSVFSILPIVSLTGTPAFAADDSRAREIMEKVDARDDGDNQVSDMQMILIDKRGNQRVREIRSFRKDKGEDTHSIMFFLSPADVKDTAFLTYDYDESERDDDQWLYLPALKKTKRIASTDKSSSFMGSDFTYADMTDRPLEEYEYQLIGEDEVRNHKVWQIQAIPITEKEKEETGYSKQVFFVRQDNYVVVRGVSWVEKGQKLKYLDVKGLEQIDGIWVTTDMTMTLKKGRTTLHETQLKLRNIEFNQPLDEARFSIRALERGL